MVNSHSKESCLYLAIGTYFLQNESRNLVVDKIPVKYQGCGGARPNMIVARHDLFLEKLNHLQITSNF